MGLLTVSGVQIDIGANLNPLKQGIAQAEREIQRLNSSSGGTGGMGGFSSLERGTRTWTDSLKNANREVANLAKQGTVAVGAFYGVFKIADGFAQIGVEAHRSKAALQALTGDAQAWADAVQRGSRYTLTSGEAAAQAFTLVKFHMADSTAEAEKFTRMIDVIALANPRLGDTANAIAQIQLAMANQSYMRLDQLGLSAIDVKKRVEELKASVKGLSTEEAFNQALLEGLQQQADALGDSLLGLGTPTDQLKAKFRELKEVVGVEIAQGFDGAATAALGFIEIWDHLKSDPVRTLSVVIEQTVGAAYGKGATSSTPQGFTEDQIMGRTWDQTGRSTITQAQMPEWMRAYSIMQHGMAEGFGVTQFGLDQDWLNEFYQLGFQSGENYWDGYYRAQTAARMQMPTTGTTSGERGTYSGWYPGSPEYERGMQTYRFQQWTAASSMLGSLIVGGQGYTGALFEGQQSLEFMLRDADELASTFSQNITGAVGQFVSKLTDGVSATGDMVDSARDVADEFERMKNMTLDEKFGIDPGRFSTDVFGEMTTALRKAGVEEEAAAAAMRQYELATGMATGASDVFGGRMDVLAGQLADGRISIDDYVNAVMELSTADFSWIDGIFGGLVDTSGIETATAFLDRLATLDTQSIAGVGAFAADPFAAMGDVSGFGGAPSPAAGAKGAGETGSPITRMIADIDQARGGISGIGDDLDTLTATRYMLNVDISVTAPSSVTIPVMTQLGEAQGAAQQTAITQGTQIEEFAEGGFTGRGGRNEFAGIVHKGEYVVPQDGALVIRDGGQGSGQPNIIQIVMDGQVVFEQVMRESDRQNVRATTRRPGGY